MMTEQIWLEQNADLIEQEEADMQYKLYLVEQAAEEEAQQGNE